MQTKPIIALDRFRARHQRRPTDLASAVIDSGSPSSSTLNAKRLKSSNHTRKLKKPISKILIQNATVQFDIGNRKKLTVASKMLKMNPKKKQWNPSLTQTRKNQWKKTHTQREFGRQQTVCSSWVASPRVKRGPMRVRHKASQSQVLSRKNISLTKETGKKTKAKMKKKPENFIQKNKRAIMGASSGFTKRLKRLMRGFTCKASASTRNEAKGAVSGREKSVFTDTMKGFYKSKKTIPIKRGGHMKNKSCVIPKRMCFAKTKMRIRERHNLIGKKQTGNESPESGQGESKLAKGQKQRDELGPNRSLLMRIGCQTRSDRECALNFQSVPAGGQDLFIDVGSFKKVVNAPLKETDSDKNAPEDQTKPEQSIFANINRHISFSLNSEDQQIKMPNEYIREINLMEDTQSQCWDLARQNPEIHVSLLDGKKTEHVKSRMNTNRLFDPNRGLKSPKMPAKHGLSRTCSQSSLNGPCRKSREFNISYNSGGQHVYESQSNYSEFYHKKIDMNTTNLSFTDHNANDSFCYKDVAYLASEPPDELPSKSPSQKASLDSGESTNVISTESPEQRRHERRDRVPAHTQLFGETRTNGLIADLLERASDKSRLTLESYRLSDDPVSKGQTLLLESSKNQGAKFGEDIKTNIYSFDRPEMKHALMGQFDANGGQKELVVRSNEEKKQRTQVDWAKTDWDLNCKSDSDNYWPKRPESGTPLERFPDIQESIIKRLESCERRESQVAPTMDHASPSQRILKVSAEKADRDREADDKKQTLAPKHYNVFKEGSFRHVDLKKQITTQSPSLSETQKENSIELECKPKQRGKWLVKTLMGGRRPSFFIKERTALCRLSQAERRERSLSHPEVEEYYIYDVQSSESAGEASSESRNDSKKSNNVNA